MSGRCPFIPTLAGCTLSYLRNDKWHHPIIAESSSVDARALCARRLGRKGRERFRLASHVASRRSTRRQGNQLASVSEKYDVMQSRRGLGRHNCKRTAEEERRVTPAEPRPESGTRASNGVWLTDSDGPLRQGVENQVFASSKNKGTRDRHAHYSRHIKEGRGVGWHFGNRTYTGFWARPEIDMSPGAQMSPAVSSQSALPLPNFCGRREAHEWMSEWISDVIV